MHSSTKEYYVLDVKNKLNSVAILNSHEIKKRFYIKKGYSVSKICKRQMILENRYILIESEIIDSEDEERFEQHLFHENKHFLYYLTTDYSIIIKSVHTEDQIEIPVPKNEHYTIDKKIYDLKKLYLSYFH